MPIVETSPLKISIWCDCDLTTTDIEAALGDVDHTVDRRQVRSTPDGRWRRNSSLCASSVSPQRHWASLALFVHALLRFDALGVDFSGATLRSSKRES
jgi:hypothetical protein